MLQNCLVTSTAKMGILSQSRVLTFLIWQIVSPTLVKSEM